MSDRDKPLTPGRMRCLQGLAFGALNMNAVDKETFVAAVVPGKTSFHQLTNADADTVIDAMKLKAGQTPTRPLVGERRRARATGVTTLITPAQRETLEQLVRRALDAGHGPEYVSGVQRRACGRQEPRTSIEAEKAIEAMKAVAARTSHTPEPA
jgi:hypothetical protein